MQINKEQKNPSPKGELFRLEKLSKLRDPLEELNNIIDWDIFKPTLQKLESLKLENNNGLEIHSPLLMFKILILQHYYGLDGKQIEYQILDRLSFCRFLGITINDAVPEEQTIWNFREKIVNKGLQDDLFPVFKKLLLILSKRSCKYKGIDQNWFFIVGF